MAATVQYGKLYGMWQHKTLTHKMASTVQHGATARHAATHKAVAYTVAATHCTTWATVQHTATHNTVAYTVTATAWHVATQNTGIQNGINCAT